MPTILIVEDNQTHRDYLFGLLGQAGHSVFAVPDARAADRLIQSGRLDLVIVGLFMPGPESLETFQAMHRHDAAFPVVALTGGLCGLTRPLADALKRLGAAAVMSRPVDPARLLELIDRLTAPRQVRRVG